MKICTVWYLEVFHLTAKNSTRGKHTLGRTQKDTYVHFDRKHSNIRKSIWYFIMDIIRAITTSLPIRENDRAEGRILYPRGQSREMSLNPSSVTLPRPFSRAPRPPATSSSIHRNNNQNRFANEVQLAAVALGVDKVTDFVKLQPRDAILVLIIRNKTMTAIELVQNLRKQGMNINRPSVNKILYKDLEEPGFISNGSPPGARPQWTPSAALAAEIDAVFYPSRKAKKAEPIGEEFSESRRTPDTAIFIDLGNVHDCLVPAASLLRSLSKDDDEEGIFLLRAYADAGCNAPGITTYGEYVITAPTDRSDAADIMMILGIDSYLRLKPYGKAVILSNDRLLSTHAEIARNMYPNADIEIVRGNKAWQELRMHIE